MLPIAQRRLFSKTISLFVGKIVTTFIKVKYHVRFLIILMESIDIIQRSRATVISAFGSTLCMLGDLL